MNELENQVIENKLVVWKLHRLDKEQKKDDKMKGLPRMFMKANEIQK
jgi:hypothetical protein